MQTHAYHFAYMGNLELPRLRSIVPESAFSTVFVGPRRIFFYKGPTSQLLGLPSTGVIAIVTYGSLGLLGSIFPRVRILTRTSVWESGNARLGYVGYWTTDTREQRSLSKSMCAMSCSIV